MSVPDLRQRQQALDPEHSFIVQAPAGSGKTELLTQRMLVLLARVQNPEEVVAVTFTRKAAAEMRHRVADALRTAGGPQPEAAHEVQTWTLARAVLKRDAELDWGLSEDAARLRVMTYDALCGHLTRQSPVLSGLSPGSRVSDDASVLYQQAALRTLALAEQDDERGDAVLNTLRHFDGNAGRLLQQLQLMLGRRDQWLGLFADGRPPAREQMEALLQQLRRKALQQVNDGFGQAQLQSALQLAAYSCEQLQRCYPEAGHRPWCGASADQLRNDVDAWPQLLELLLTQKGEWRSARGISKKQGFPTAKDGPPEAAERKQLLVELLAELQHQAGLDQQLHSLRELPAAQFSEAQWQALAALIETLRTAAAQLKLVCSQRGELDFIEVAASACEALGSPQAPSDLALKLDYRIQHLLLDEFQDTSLQQYELIQRLTAGWSSGDGRSLFAVGDPMQSIYRFRQADVGLFLRAWDQGIGGVAMQPLRLQSNFRSVPALVEWVNRAFVHAFPAHDDPTAGAARFAPAAAVRAAQSGAEVYCHPYPADAAVQEAETAVAVVRRALAEGAKSIAILGRARSHLGAIGAALAQAGIAYQAVELDSMAQRPEVRDLRALSGALAHPADRLNWFSVLRAPWAGLLLDDLHAIAASIGAQGSVAEFLAAADYQTLSAEGRSICARVAQLLLPAIHARGRQPFAQLIEATWLRLGGASVAGIAQPSVEAYFALLDEHCTAGDLVDFAALDQALARQKISAAADANCRVQLLTMHKSKGLQFDVVLLPGLHHGNPRRDQPPVIFCQVAADAQADPQLLLAPIHPSGREKDSIYDYAYRLDGEREALERSRLLYVAATRARNALHLFGAIEQHEDGSNKAPTAGSLLSLIWPAVEGDFALGSQTSAVQDIAAESRMLRRLPPDWQAPQWPGQQSAAVADSPVHRGAPQPALYDPQRISAQRLGSVFHRFAQAAAEQPERLQRTHLAAQLEGALQAEGLQGEILAAASQRLLRAVNTLLDSDRGQWILAEHQAAACEVELGSMIDGVAAQRIVDRSFIDEQGRRWIIDYKTSDTDGDVAAFVDAQQAQYREQLDGYARIYAQLESRPIRCGLYFPMLDAWREWAPSE